MNHDRFDLARQGPGMVRPPEQPVREKIAEPIEQLEALDAVLEPLQKAVHTDETDEQLDVLVQAAVGTMAGVLKPLGTALTRLPMGPGTPVARPVRRSRCITRWGTAPVSYGKSVPRTGRPAPKESAAQCSAGGWRPSR